jgi:hypothetical protein
LSIANDAQEEEEEEEIIRHLLGCVPWDCVSAKLDSLVYGEHSSCVLCSFDKRL